MLRVRTGGSGYIFDVLKKAPTQQTLVDRLELTRNGLEFKTLLNAPTMVIKNVIYHGVTATSTRYLREGDFLSWLEEHGHFFSLQEDRVKPIEQAPELSAMINDSGFTVRGLPQIGATMNGLVVSGFNGGIRGDMVFNGCINFSERAS
jgi:hypothetical protein